jgi:signal transduction histidine kinase
MNWYGLSNLLTGVTGASLAIFAFLRGSERRIVRLWFGFALSAAIYGYGGYIVTLAESAADALHWWRMAYIGIIFIPCFFVFFVYEFLEIKRKYVLYAVAIVSAAFLFLNLFSNRLFLNKCTLYFENLEWATPVYFIYPPGPFLIVFIIVGFFGLVSYGSFEMIVNYRRLSPIKQTQVKYFLIAAVLGFIGGGASFLPCFGISYYPVSNFTVPLYFIIVSYAIMRYNLLDIKVAVTRTGIFIAVYTFVLGIPFVMAIKLRDRLFDGLGNNWWIVPLGSLAVLATAGPFIYIYFQQKAENRLLKEQRNYQRVLKQAGMEMSRIHNLQELMDLVLDIVVHEVRIAKCGIYIYDKNSDKFSLKAGHSNAQNNLVVNIENNNPLIKWFENYSELLVYEGIKQRLESDPGEILENIKREMEKLSAEVIVPSFLEESLLSLLVLGKKATSAIYTYEDIAAFSILSNQIAIAIDNAKLYENMEELVDKRTRELVDTQKQLIQAEKLATVGTLAGGVAHEINNPLAAILANVQILLAESNGYDEDSKESLELIEEATKRCRNIVQKLMVYAKKPLEQAQVKNVNLKDAVDSVVNFLEYQFKQDNIKISVNSPKEVCEVSGNQNELEQVITNIILNAKDAILKEKKKGEIDIAFDKSGNYVNLKIKDNGPGIPKDVLSKIFDPFFTTKDIGKGLGLGLSICQSIIEKHGGSIVVETKESIGTEFAIKLPVSGEPITQNA